MKEQLERSLQQVLLQVALIDGQHLTGTIGGHTDMKQGVEDPVLLNRLVRIGYGVKQSFFGEKNGVLVLVLSEEEREKLAMLYYPGDKRLNRVIAAELVQEIGSVLLGGVIAGLVEAGRAIQFVEHVDLLMGPFENMLTEEENSGSIDMYELTLDYGKRGVLRPLLIVAEREKETNCDG